jgi:hypothetical protein
LLLCPEPRHQFIDAFLRRAVQEACQEIGGIALRIDAFNFQVSINDAKHAQFSPSSSLPAKRSFLLDRLSELELHTIRGRLTAGVFAKAERGKLALTLPVGFLHDPSGVVVKDPDMALQDFVVDRGLPVAH